MKSTFFLYGLLISLLLQNCSLKGKKVEDEIRVFCAASLAEIITELKDTFLLHHQVAIKLNIASSGILARQIEQGNAADIFISANEHWSGYAEKLGLFSNRVPLYQNRLVMVAPKIVTLDTIDFTKPLPPSFNGYLSMGDPAHVPAGMYACQALTSLGWYHELEDRILAAKDVQSAIKIVEMGECELGIVYYSDAIQSQKVKILGTFPSDKHAPIILFALLAKNNTPVSSEFFDLLSDNSMQPIWIKYGFIPIDTLTRL